MIKAPIFIGGAGRSGTTLLRVILDTHPNIVCGPEFKLLPEIARLWTLGMQISPILQTYELGPREFNDAHRRFIESLLHRYLRASGKKRLAEKSPNNIFYFFQLSRIFPDARLIHVVRDGRDAVCSLLTMDWRDPATGRKPAYVANAAAAVEYWARAVRAGLEAARALPSDSFYLLRYEDMVTRPKETLEPLFTFIGEAWDPCVLDFHLKKREGTKESSDGQVARRLYTHAAGRWQRDLNEQDRETFKRIAGDVLVELGYASDNNW